MWECIANQIRGWLRSTCYANVPCQLRSRGLRASGVLNVEGHGLIGGGQLVRPTPKEVVVVVCVFVGGGGVEQPLNGSRAGAGAGAAGSGSRGMNGICTMQVRSITRYRDLTIQPHGYGLTQGAMQAREKGRWLGGSPCGAARQCSARRAPSPIRCTSLASQGPL
jgi:hypothetical protein